MHAIWVYVLCAHVPPNSREVDLRTLHTQPLQRRVAIQMRRIFRRRKIDRAFSFPPWSMLDGSFCTATTEEKSCICARCPKLSKARVELHAPGAPVAADAKGASYAIEIVQRVAPTGVPFIRCGLRHLLSVCIEILSTDASVRNLGLIGNSIFADRQRIRVVRTGPGSRHSRGRSESNRISALMAIVRTVSSLDGAWLECCSIS